MKFSELKTALGAENGALKNAQLTITANTLTSNIHTLITRCYDDKPIVIQDAELVTEDSACNTLTIRGKSTFLNYPDRETEARFFLDPQGCVQLFLKYKLIGSQPEPNGWKFSKSFPDLPQVPNYNEPTLFDRTTQKVIQPMTVPLDELILCDAYYVVVSEPQREPEFGVDLKWGINFVGHMLPAGSLRIIETLFGHHDEIKVSGTIRKPLPTETPEQLALTYPASLERLQYPWTIEKECIEGLPGILLKVDLGIDYSVLQDKINFRADSLYLYTPLRNDWTLVGTNPQFIPMQAYTGRIVLAVENGQPIELDIVSPSRIGIDELILIGKFEGVSLSNLAQLSGLTGTGDSLIGELPEDLQNKLESAGETLGALELVNARIDVDYIDTNQPRLSYVSFTVGMPNLNWEIWEDDFEISSVFCSFDIYEPLSTENDPEFGRDLEVTVYGQLKIKDVPFSVYASNKDGFTVYAEMAEAQTLPLKEILKQYAIDVPDLSDLTINTFRVGIAPRSAYSMAMSMAQEPNPWVIPLGMGGGLLVKDVAVGFMKPVKGNVQGSISGTVAFGDFAEIAITYDIPGDIILRGMLPEVKLSQVTGHLTGMPLDMPDGFDLTFVNSSVLIQKQTANWVFQLATSLEGLGNLAFEVRRMPKGWGFALGLAISTGDLSQLDGLGSMAQEFREWFPLNQLVLMLVSFDDSSGTFQFPAFDQFNNTALSGSKIALPSTITTITKGIYFFGSTQFDRSNKTLKPIMDLLKIPEGTDLELLMVYQKDTNRFQLGISLETFLTPTGSTTCDYGNTCLTGTLFADSGGGTGLQFGLSACLKTIIQGTKVDFNVTLVTTPCGFFISGTMDTKRPIDFGPVQLADLALEVGISSTGLPCIGFAGSLEVAGLFHSSIAVMVDTGHPSNSMVAGSLSDLTLKKIVDKIAGNDADKIPDWLDEILEEVAILGPMDGAFIVPESDSAEVKTALDNYDAPTISKAFSTHGKIDGFPTSPDDLTLFKDKEEPCWYMTSLTGSGEDSLITHYQARYDGKTGQIEIKREAQFYCVLDPAGTRIGKFYYRPGIRVSGVLQFLALRAEVDIEVQQSRGIRIDAEIDPIVVIDPKFFSISNMDDPNQGACLSLQTYQEGDISPHFNINGGLELLGLKHEIFANLTKDGFEFDLNGDLIPAVNFDLHACFNSVTDLSIGGALKIAVGTIDLGPLGSISINTGVAGVLDLSVKGSTIKVDLDASFVLAGTTHNLVTLHLDYNTAALLDLVDLVWEKVKEYLEDLLLDAAKWAELIAAGLVGGVEDMASVLKDAYSKGAQEAAQLMQLAGQSVVEIGDGLKNVYELTADGAVQVLQNIGYGANEVAEVLKNTFSYGANEVANALQNAFNLTAEAAAPILQGIGYGANEVAKALQNTFNLTAQTTADILKGIGYGANEVANALQNTFNLTAQTTADILKGIGYGANEVANALQNTFNLTAEAAAPILQGIGYGANEVAKALQNTFNLTAEAAAPILRDMGYGANEVAKALQSTFNLTAQATADILKGVGYGANEVAKVLQNAFNLSREATESILRDIGYGANEVAKALDSAFGTVRRWIEDVGKKLDPTRW